MPFLNGTEVLLSYTVRKYRELHKIDANAVVDILRNLHQIVTGIHQAGVVIGDFNDLNVLVANHRETYLVDADSMQFGQFPCRTFTVRFVDPLLCSPDKLVRQQPPTHPAIGTPTRRCCSRLCCC